MSEKQKGFEYICRQRKLKENETVIGLRESEKLVGQLYPVLVDEEGNVLDGQHRLKANPNWRKETVKDIDSERKKAMIRLHANWQRRPHFDRERELTELAKVTGWKGAAPYAAFLGCSIRTIQRYLPWEYKLRKRDPKRQLSLSEEENASSYEVERRKQLLKEEEASAPAWEKRQEEDLERMKQGKPSTEWPKERLLGFLGNRLYNNVSERTESPEELLNSPQIKEGCEFYLTRLALLKTPQQEILSFLRDYRQEHLKELEKIRESKDRQEAFKRKVDELYAKFKQVTVEFTDGTAFPLNVRRMSNETLYDGNEQIRRDNAKYLEFYVKQVILPVIAEELLGFTKYGALLEREAEI